MVLDGPYLILSSTVIYNVYLFPTNIKIKCINAFLVNNKQQEKTPHSLLSNYANSKPQFQGFRHSENANRKFKLCMYSLITISHSKHYYTFSLLSTSSAAAYQTAMKPNKLHVSKFGCRNPPLG